MGKKHKTPISPYVDGMVKFLSDVFEESPWNLSEEALAAANSLVVRQSSWRINFLLK